MIDMLKIFSTQLGSFFKKIGEQEVELEDGARLLAQTVIGEGRIFVHGFREMEAVMIEALFGVEPFPKAERLFVGGEMQIVNPTDRIVIISRFSDDTEILELAKSISHVPIVAISAVTNDLLSEYVDVHIDTKLIKPILPNEDGSRYGMPTTMTALFAYYGLLFSVKEIVDEYE